ncbi:MAG: STAS domain-containing protein [Roseiflexaceae bacterium]
MRLSQRQASLITMGVQVAGLVITLLAVGGRGIDTYFFALLGATGVYVLLTVLYARGWSYARQLMVIAVTLVTSLTTGLQGGFNVQILIPAVVALVLASPAWVLGSAIATWGIVLARAGGGGSYANPEGGIFYIVVVASMLVARVAIETALRRAEENGRRAEEERAQTGHQAALLAAANQRQEDQLAQQQALLDLVVSLETPAIRLADGVLFVPIVGHLDSRRAERLIERLLADAHSQRTQLVILDLAGVGLVDTGIAQVLGQAAQSVRLLGCSVCLSGISAAVAATMVHLGIQFEGVRIVQNPQEALELFEVRSRRF